MGFTETAERIWVRRHEWLDLNITVVGGERGLVVVDTHASERAAREVIAAVEQLGAGEVVAVVNTHEHFDHTFGNDAFHTAYAAAPIVAHETAARRTAEAGAGAKAAYAESSDEPHREEVLATSIVAADQVFSSATTLDLGDRFLELVHPGRGHTGGDIVVRVPDADVLIAGDLVEESPERDHAPGFGDDCYPFEWPLSLDIVLGLTTPRSLVVPGHGAVVDRDFVEDQRNAIGTVAETIRDLASRGVPLDAALAAGEWPFRREVLADAVARGYAQLPRSQKRLPLI